MDWILTIAWVISTQGATTAPIIVRDPPRVMASQEACFKSADALLRQPRADGVTPLPACHLGQAKP